MNALTWRQYAAQFQPLHKRILELLWINYPEEFITARLHRPKTLLSRVHARQGTEAIKFFIEFCPAKRHFRTVIMLKPLGIPGAQWRLVMIDITDGVTLYLTEGAHQIWNQAVAANVCRAIDVFTGRAMSLYLVEALACSEQIYLFQAVVGQSPDQFELLPTNKSAHNQAQLMLRTLKS